MKKEELTGLGLTEEQVKGVFELNGKDVNSAKESVKAEMQTEIDNLNTQLQTTKQSLSQFEGINPEEMSAEIQNLNAKLAEQEMNYKAQIAKRDFNDLLDKSITSAGGRNAKAISALLNLDALFESKNQKEDITSAIEEVKKANDYLFESNEPIKNAVAKTSNGQSTGKAGSVDATELEKARKVMGLKGKGK